MKAKRSISTAAVTGASGFLGGHLISQLSKAGTRVLAVSRRKPAFFTDEIEWLAGGSDEPQIMDRVCRESDVIFHLAAQTSPHDADTDPVGDLEGNVTKTLQLLEFTRRLSRRNMVIFASTATTIGLPVSVPSDESASAHPRSIYDIHKLTSEMHLAHYVERGWVQGGSLRISNAYGAGIGMSKTDRCIVNRAVLLALAGQDLVIYGHGKYLRDYVYVDDICVAFVRAAEHGEAMQGRSFFIGSGVGTTVAEAFVMVAEEVEAATGRAVNVRHIPEPGSMSIIDRRDFVADTSAFKTLTGWFPEVDLREGIRRTIAAYRVSPGSSQERV